MSGRHEDEREPELSELGLGHVRVGRVARFGATWLLSIAAHAALLLSFVGPAPKTAAPRGVEKMAEFVLTRAKRPMVAHQKRLALVAEARAARARSALELGDFILRANAIDAEEEGLVFDLDGARKVYRARVRALQLELATKPVTEAVPLVFADIGYTGTPGGRMGDALFEARGSCEPVSQLVAAALHDAGRPGDARLRFYGGAVDGVTHITPVAAASSGEIDLMTGGAPQPGGVVFSAAEIVEVYARAHHLEAGHGSRRSPFVLSSWTSGYPENGDVFEGALPLFSPRAIAAAREAPADRGDPGNTDPSPLEDIDPPCTFGVSVAWLDPPSASEIEPSSDLDIELVRAPTPAQLERISERITEAERVRVGRRTDLAARLVDSACLTALYDQAGLAFSLASQASVSERAVHAAHSERERGASALRELAALPPADRLSIGRRVDELAMGRGWVLLFLEGGEAPVLDLLTDEEIRYGRTLAHAALLVAPGTRERAVLLAEELPLSTQIDLMHELMHAYDHARPWAATYPLDLAGMPEAVATRFARNYAVFRALAWRLWDAARSPEATIAALLREADAAELDDESRDAIALYYSKHYFRIVRSRQDAPELIANVVTLLEDNGLPGLLALRAEADLVPSERAALDAKP